MLPYNASLQMSFPLLDEKKNMIKLTGWPTGGGVGVGGESSWPNNQFISVSMESCSQVLCSELLY